MDEGRVNQAVTFLNHPKVRTVDKEKQIAFLKKKGLSDAEISEAYDRQAAGGTKIDLSPDLPTKPVSVSSTQLNLRKTNLSTFPDLSTCANITILNLSLNKLTTIPAEIGKLTNLAVFNVQQNLITNAGISPELFDLDSLKDVNFAYNKLTSLEGFGKLTNLVKVNVSGNLIEAVPDEVVNWQSAEIVLLHNNQLKTVSPCLALITTLKQVVRTIADVDWEWRPATGTATGCEKGTTKCVAGIDNIQLNR